MLLKRDGWLTLHKEMTKFSVDKIDLTFSKSRNLPQRKLFFLWCRSGGPSPPPHHGEGQCRRFLGGTAERGGSGEGTLDTRDGQPCSEAAQRGRDRQDTSTVPSPWRHCVCVSSLYLFKNSGERLDFVEHPELIRNTT